MWIWIGKEVGRMSEELEEGKWETTIRIYYIKNIFHSFLKKKESKTEGIVQR